MCGIAFSIGGSKEDAAGFVERANLLMKHRGPDGEGIFQDDFVALAHRRLAILDLSEAGAQPMHTPDRRYVIAYNGEVYNHLELRNKFLPDYPFRGHSDTETILALYALQGVQMQQHLVGMWAIAIWDSLEKTMFISRDRYGQKPLYWRFAKNGSFHFASEMKPLLETDERPHLNPTALVEYLALGNYGHLGPQTFFKDIHHFPQGNYTIIKSGETSFKPKPYWQLPQVEDRDKVPFDTKKKAQLRAAIDEAVSSQLLSDVTIGATLSGGIDSAVTVGLMAKNTGKGFPVFTAQTSGSKWDESQYVKAVESKWGADKVQIHWKELLNIKLSDSLPQYIHSQEEPFGDPSIMAHGFLMDMAKENGIKVVIGGQGSDELFFGYKNMTTALLAQGIRKGNFGWLKDNIQTYKLSKGELARIGLSAFAPGIENTLRERSRKQRRSFIDASLLSKVDETSIYLANSTDFYDVWNESVNRVHLPHLVHYDDRNGMARSLEGRMPFLDHRIAESISDIQSKDLFRNGKNKSVLRDACEDIVPQEILNRRDKIGFYTPLPAMMQNEAALIDKMIQDFLPKGIINETSLDFINLPENYLIKFRVLSVAVWVKMFKVSL